MKIGDKMLVVDGSYAMLLKGDIVEEARSGTEPMDNTWIVMGKGEFPTGLSYDKRVVVYKNNVMLSDGDRVLFIRDSFLKPAIDTIRLQELRVEYKKGFDSGMKGSDLANQRGKEDARTGYNLDLKRLAEEYQQGRYDIKETILKKLERDMLPSCRCSNCICKRKAINDVKSVE